MRVIKRVLLQLLLLVGIGVNIAFLLINLKPDRPHLARRRHMKILLRASEPRAKWMMANELSEFAAAHDLDLEMVLAKDFDEVHDKLVEESKKPSGMLLADIDDEWTDDLREEKAIRPIEEGAEKGEAGPALDDYLPEGAERAKIEGRIWLLPKRAQVDIIAYLKPAVEDAYLHWEKHRKEIDAALKEANGYGLPKGYDLERNPESWDSYDVFVAAWTWAHEPAAWAEPIAANVPIGAALPPAIVKPRLASRTGKGEDALRDLVAQFYRLGLKPAELKNPEAPAILDALQWRAMMRKHHLYSPECEAPEGLEAFGVNQLLHDRKAAYGPINQPDAFWVHGGTRRDADPGMRGPSDLAFAPMPAGASLEIDPKSGEPKRKGKTFSFEEVHLWAAPIHTPDIALSWQLARFLTQRGLQQRETEAEGMLPIRKDLRTNYQVTFRVDWMQDVLHSSYVQIARGSGDLPSDLDQLDAALLAERERVLAQPGVTLEAVREAAHGK
jgi:ABC-type glycerol-3-phosphate transport system substrate-binding protein